MEEILYDLQIQVVTEKRKSNSLEEFFSAYFFPVTRVTKVMGCHGVGIPQGSCRFHANQQNSLERLEPGCSEAAAASSAAVGSRRGACADPHVLAAVSGSSRGCWSKVRELFLPRANRVTALTHTDCIKILLNCWHRLADTFHCFQTIVTQS